MLQNKLNPNISKDCAVLTEELIAQGYFKKEVERVFFAPNLSFGEIFQLIRRHHKIEKSSFSNRPKEYLIQTSTESRIFTIY